MFHFYYFSDLANQIGEDNVPRKSWKALLLSNAAFRHVHT